MELELDRIDRKRWNGTCPVILAHVVAVDDYHGIFLNGLGSPFYFIMGCT